VMWRGLTWTPKPGKTRSKPSRGGHLNGFVT
jgi:hypothetical protein